MYTMKCLQKQKHKDNEMANLYVIERLSLHNKVRFTSNNLTIELDYNLKNRNLPISYEQIIDSVSYNETF